MRGGIKAGSFISKVRAFFTDFLILGSGGGPRNQVPDEGFESEEGWHEISNILPTETRILDSKSGQAGHNHRPVTRSLF